MVMPDGQSGKRRFVPSEGAARANPNRVTVQIDRYVTAIVESDQPVRALVDMIKVVEAERVALEARLALIDAENSGADNVSLHPAALDDNIETIHAALTGEAEGENAAPFRAAFGNLFERVVVHETPRAAQYEVTP